MWALSICLNLSNKWWLQIKVILGKISLSLCLKSRPNCRMNRMLQILWTEVKIRISLCLWHSSASKSRTDLVGSSVESRPAISNGTLADTGIVITCLTYVAFPDQLRSDLSRQFSGFPKFPLSNLKRSHNRSHSLWIEQIRIYHLPLPRCFLEWQFCGDHWGYNANLGTLPKGQVLD